MTSEPISALIRHDINNTEQLCTLLLEERTSLEKRDLQALQTLLHQKSLLLADIENNGRNCKTLLSQAGYNCDRQGMAEFCAQQNQSALYQQLQDNLKRCKELTLVNGAIVHRSKINTLKIVDILRGIPTGSGLYTSEGEATQAAEPRSLGNA